METPRTLRVGAAQVSILNAGDLQLRLASEFATPEELWRPQYTDVFDVPALFPSLSALIQLDGVTALVDTNDYQATITPDTEYFIPGYTPPPSIATQLASMGVAPEMVDQLIITHAHWDHFAGVTRAGGNGYEPVYPRARVYLGQADWEDAETQTALANPDSLEARTLGAVNARGLLQFVSDTREIAPGITIIPAPGETPGHQIVRIHSGGETIYLLGDLIHHPVEIEHPDWMVTWATPAAMLASRQRLIADALAENALLIAAHIAFPGRLERTETGARWQDSE
jgi:glyoxylase-like metal-dependent hydrolase (beta-lactamase superfamily II)